jgi:hypothetical protein
MEITQHRLVRISARTATLSTGDTLLRMKLINLNWKGDPEETELTLFCEDADTAKQYAMVIDALDKSLHPAEQSTAED